ncbi:MAG: 4Fe-4S binding protein [Pseudomonadota bacterium]
MEDIYKKLARHLDNTPGGFPETESGVEIRILKQLFNPDEAELAAQLFMLPETVDSIAARTGKSSSELESILKEMTQKGLIVHSGKGGIDYYMGAQFVVGIWEYQVNRLTDTLIRDFNEYVPHLMADQDRQKTKQLRVVPVSQAITADMKVMDYEAAENIIRAQSKILVAPCICRREHTMVGKGCGKLEEACLVFGSGAYYYEERGIGRTISQDEAVAILYKGVEQGLVLQPGNSKKPLNICMCCGCCCQILSNIKKSDAPALAVNSSYHAQVDEDTCTACEACSDICPMDAITMDQTARVALNRCIGCGLCVTACSFDSMSLVPKEDAQRWEPPVNTVETYMTIAREKGFL